MEKLGGKFMVDAMFEKDIGLWPNNDTEENRSKLPMIRGLVENGALDWPTQALIHEVLSIHTSDLQHIHGRGRPYSAEKIFYLPTGIAGDCHAMAAFGWVMDQKLCIVNGFADKTNYHSWLYNAEKDVVIEPTPIERYAYFGYIVEDKVRFVINELSRISDLFIEGQLPRELALPFFLRWVKILEKAK